MAAGSLSIVGWLLYDANRATTHPLRLSSTPTLAASLEQADASLLSSLVAAVLSLAALLGVWGLIVTHRISGPCVVVTRLESRPLCSILHGSSLSSKPWIGPSSFSKKGNKNLKLMMLVEVFRKGK